MTHPLFTKHQSTLDKAIATITSREFWSPYPEVPSGKIYGETAKADGLAAFNARLNKAFTLDQPGIEGVVGNGEKDGKKSAERTPWGVDLNIQYPKMNIDTLIPAMQLELKSWRDAGIQTRTGICLEILDRLSKASFEIGNSNYMCTGQSFVMGFQSGGPHAQDRGLEALAYAYQAMTQTAKHATWVKPQGKHAPLTIEKTYTIVPKGISLVVACATFPTWNSYPGLFASLVSGNPVIVKPHPNAILPLAISVEIIQQVLKENGFAPHLVSMVADDIDQPIAKTLATHPQVKLIDFTGSSEFGQWIEDNAKQAQVYSEKSGINSLMVDSTDDITGLVNNLAFSLCLYSGQMCTTPQNIYLPAQGIQTDKGFYSFVQFATALVSAIENLLDDPRRVIDVLGAIQSPATKERIDSASKLGEVLLSSKPQQHPQFADARMASPMVIKVAADDKTAYMQEMFGPIIFLIATNSTEQSIALATQSAITHGAITWGGYSISEQVLTDMHNASLDAGVALSCNLTGGLFVNQAAAFSDFHASGLNPAANASLTDGNFVAGRFVVVQNRRHG